MSAEQRDNNLGIDSELRNTDPAEYDRLLRAKIRELEKLWGDDDKPKESPEPRT